MKNNAIEFGDWLKTFQPLTKENDQWVLDCQISTEELYEGFLRDKANVIGDVCNEINAIESPTSTATDIESIRKSLEQDFEMDCNKCMEHPCICNKPSEELSREGDSRTTDGKMDCPYCQGNGWTAEHGCDGTQVMCLVTCPIQVECENCSGTGEIDDLPSQPLIMAGHPLTCCGYQGCKREINEGILIEREHDFICPCGKYTQTLYHPNPKPEGQGKEVTAITAMQELIKEINERIGVIESLGNKDDRFDEGSLSYLNTIKRVATELLAKEREQLINTYDAAYLNGLVQNNIKAVEHFTNTN